MNTIESLEAHAQTRYARLWREWKPDYTYKHAKGARIARILTETGGLAPLALEIGVGPGGVAAAVSRFGTRVIGLDLSAEALARASEHCRSARVSLLRASGFSLPFRDCSLPLVYAPQVLHLFDTRGRLAMMHEVHRVLLPGGRFVFDMKNASSHLVRLARYTADRRKARFPPHAQITALLQDAGFSTVIRTPGVLPLVRWSQVPNVAVLRLLAHTTFFVAVRPASSGNA